MTRRTCCCIDIFVTLFFSFSLLTLVAGAPPNVTNDLSASDAEGRQLKHVHVVFAHKLIAPLTNGSEYGFPEKLDYRHFLENTSDMPNEHKMDMFNLGVFLRQRYDEFLGAIYYPEVMEMRTSGYFLSMISGLLVNAGLWPPADSQKWKDDLDWQPIPTNYEQIDKDALFLGTFCPRFRTEEILMLEQDDAINAEISLHKSFFDYVTSNYGKTVEHPSEIAQLYSCFETIATDPNGTLPWWAESIFPDGVMRNVSLLSYDLLSRSYIQKQLNGGGFINKILEDSMKIVAANKTFVGRNESRDFKISMYSGEERNVVGVLQALNLWSTPHIPESGASIILELRYDSTDDVYGFEIFYYTGVENNETIALNLPGCNKFCRLDDFASILGEVLPADENLLCHATLTPTPPADKDQTESSAARSPHQQPLCLTHFLIPLIAVLSSKF